MITAIVSSKGGVGKTTFTANLAGLLAEHYNKRVLVVDADIQPTLSSYYQITNRSKNGLKHLITQATIDDVISQTIIDRLDLIYSDDPAGTLSSFILNTADGRMRLRYTLKQLVEQYDYIFVDTQGAFGPLQDVAIFAADRLISPIAPDKLSAGEFKRGTLDKVNDIRTMGSRMGMAVGPLDGLLYRVERTTNTALISQAIKTMAEKRDDFTVLNTVVPHRAAYKDAPTRGLPVHLMDPLSKKGKRLSAMETMCAVAEELFPVLAASEGGQER